MPSVESSPGYESEEDTCFGKAGPATGGQGTDMALDEEELDAVRSDTVMMKRKRSDSPGLLPKVVCACTLGWVRVRVPYPSYSTLLQGP